MVRSADEAMANWKGLPQELLELIAQRLAIEDFLAFGVVCTSWRSAAAKETYDAKSKVPWLMDYACDSTTKFCSLSWGKIHRVNLPGSQARTLSPPGWMLVLNGDGEYRIFNPLLRVVIEIPALEKPLSKSHLSGELDGLVGHLFGCPRIDRIALSSSPSLSRSYTVMISIGWDLGPPGLAFHRSGEDAWTVVSPAKHPPKHPPWPYVLQLIYHDGSFVALDGRHRIMTLNESERRMELQLDLRQNLGDCPCLIERSGSLLVAWKMWADGDGFWVVEVDLEKRTQKEVESLGNGSLFLNDNSPFCIEFNIGSCLPGIKPNHVYFSDYVDEKKNWKSYSMDKGKFETCFDPASHCYASQWFQTDF